MENVLDNKMKDTMKTVFDGIDSLIDTKKVIGEPYIVGETTIVPIMETSMGMAIGDFSREKQAGGVHLKISPIACLIIQNGFTKLVNVSNQDVVAKALDMIPDLVDKLTKTQSISDGTKEKIKALKPVNKKI